MLHYRLFSAQIAFGAPLPVRWERVKRTLDSLEPWRTDWHSQRTWNPCMTETLKRLSPQMSLKQSRSTLSRIYQICFFFFSFFFFVDQSLVYHITNDDKTSLIIKITANNWALIDPPPVSNLCLRLFGLTWRLHWRSDAMGGSPRNSASTDIHPLFYIQSVPRPELPPPTRDNKTHPCRRPAFFLEGSNGVAD